MASRHGSSHPSRRAAGRSVGQFVIDKDIGKGSFAQVYMGWHKETKAVVAIKSVELDRLNKKLKENLYSEIKILKTLRHPHIVALHDCFESSTHINLIMEYCELGDLSMFIRKRDKLATHSATHDMARKYPSAPGSGLNEVIIRHFLKQLASALEFLRSKNYVHRDVKPQNLLLLPSQSYRSARGANIMEASQESLIPIAGLASLPMLKLGDFGFARVLPSTSLADTLCGSPLYMAPEILRYERYDATADLWSVGTVLYEMITGKPPFRARNHVELLRKIEAAEDVIRFPKEVTVSADMKSLVRSLLKRSPVERVSFKNFFAHPVVTGDIPGVVEDDLPKVEKPVPSSSPRLNSPRQTGDDSAPDARVTARDAARDAARESGLSRSPRDLQPRAPQSDSPGEGHSRRQAVAPRDILKGLGIQRPQAHHAISFPNQTPMVRRGSRDATLPATSLVQEGPKGRLPGIRQGVEEQKAVQDVMFERDYVVVERRQVEVNALADELAANEKYASPSPTSSRATQMTRRYTQQGAPNSTTGAIAVPASRIALVAQGRPGHDRRPSYEKIMAANPTSASSAISKAIQDASLRLFGFKVPTRGGKGPSPPMYQPFPTYPIPLAGLGALGDGRDSQSSDENIGAALSIEEFATRSDCVYGFAEVKYKQLVPLAPSMDHGLGGVGADQLAEEEEDLTVEAIVSLSEESLVLYVTSLALLAKAMDVASVWWSKEGVTEAPSGVSAALAQSVVQRINAVVQWVRQRFNEVLEKSEIVRLKLIEAQKKLPEDHPSHPSNQEIDLTASSSGSSWKPVHLTPGISAEKLMYDRALEMSRAAAIDEVTNENLAGCEISYITAIRMLEAVLDATNGSLVKKLPYRKNSGKDAVRPSSGDLDSDEEAHVRKMIKMITGRLGTVRKKQQRIAEASSLVQQSPSLAPKRRSGDTTPRSVPSHTSS